MMIKLAKYMKWAMNHARTRLQYPSFLLVTILSFVISKYREN